MIDKQVEKQRVHLRGHYLWPVIKLIDDFILKDIEFVNIFHIICGKVKD